jgi:hypothetical protein
MRQALQICNHYIFNYCPLHSITTLVDLFYLTIYTPGFTLQALFSTLDIALQPGLYISIK